MHVSNHDFKVFTQLLNVTGTGEVWVLKLVPNGKYPVRAPGRHGPVALALLKGCRRPHIGSLHLSLRLKSKTLI